MKATDSHRHLTDQQLKEHSDTDQAVINKLTIENYKDRHKAVMNDLVITCKAHYESWVASTLLRQDTPMRSVMKISRYCSDFMSTHKEKTTKLLQHKKCQGDLFGSKLFGRLEKQAGTTTSLHQRIIDLLSNETTPLQQIMHIHALFFYRLHKTVLGSSKEEQQSKIQGIINDTMKDRGRKKTNKRTKTTSQYGFTNLDVFKRGLGKSNQKHERGCDLFSQDKKSTHHTAMKKLKMPFCAGISRHTATFLTGLLLSDELNKSETKEYLCHIFAYLAGGGHHSFYEVYTVAEALGKEFDVLSDLSVHDYKKSIPDSIEKILSEPKEGQSLNHLRPN